jgi:hypothetical protein
VHTCFWYGRRRTVLRRLGLHRVPGRRRRSSAAQGCRRGGLRADPALHARDTMPGLAGSSPHRAAPRQGWRLPSSGGVRPYHADAGHRARGRVVRAPHTRCDAGDLLCGVLLGEGLAPVLVAPDRRPARIHRYHGDALVGGHLREPVAELGRGEAGDGAAEPLPAPSTAHPLPAGLAGVGEVEVLDHHRRAATLTDDREQPADRRTQPPITSRSRHTVQVQRHVHGEPDRVAAAVDNPAGDMIGVDVHGQHPAGQRLVVGDRRRRRRLP